MAVRASSRIISVVLLIASTGSGQATEHRTEQGAGERIAREASGSSRTSGDGIHHQPDPGTRERPEQPGKLDIHEAHLPMPLLAGWASGTFDTSLRVINGKTTGRGLLADTTDPGLEDALSNEPSHHLLEDAVAVLGIDTKQA